jgi:hypothetical protein
MYMMFVTQETRLYASTTCYGGDSFTILYVDDTCTSQKAHLWPSMACYDGSFNYLYVDICTSSEIPYGPPRPDTGIALLFLCVRDVRTSQATHLCLYVSASYWDIVTFLYADDVRTSQETRL